VPLKAITRLSDQGPSPAQQAESFRIRVLIGPMQGRNDEILEHMAKLIGRGEWRFNLGSGMIEMEKGGRIKLLENGTFQALI
jgi:hypothetical protein